MKILVFDVETTGLPKKRRAALDDFDNWPYIVQLSWVVYDVIDGGIESIDDSIIRLPENIDIPSESTLVHGISNEIMIKEGKDLKIELIYFLTDCANSDLLVAHNIEFDETIISVECLRYFYNNSFKDIKTPRYCTMRKSIKRYKKWLKLELLHEKLFEQKLQNLHNSLNDVYVCLRCFIKLYFNKDVLTNKRFVNEKNENIQTFKKSYSELIRL